MGLPAECIVPWPNPQGNVPKIIHSAACVILWHESSGYHVPFPEGILANNFLSNQTI